MKSLKDEVINIESKNVELDKIHMETAGDQVLFRKKSKSLKKEIKKLSNEVFNKNNELIERINKKKENWSVLLDLKLELSKVELFKAKILENHRKLRFEHYKKMSPFMKKKRGIRKDINIINEKIMGIIKNG